MRYQDLMARIVVVGPRGEGPTSWLPSFGYELSSLGLKGEDLLSYLEATGHARPPETVERESQEGNAVGALVARLVWRAHEYMLYNHVPFLYAGDPSTAALYGIPLHYVFRLPWNTSECLVAEENHGIFVHGPKA